LVLKWKGGKSQWPPTSIPGKEKKKKGRRGMTGVFDFGLTELERDLLSLQAVLGGGGEKEKLGKSLILPFYGKLHGRKGKGERKGKEKVGCSFPPAGGAGGTLINLLLGRPDGYWGKKKRRRKEKERDHYLIINPSFPYTEGGRGKRKVKNRRAGTALREKRRLMPSSGRHMPRGGKNMRKKGFKYTNFSSTAKKRGRNRPSSRNKEKKRQPRSQTEGQEKGGGG